MSSERPVTIPGPPDLEGRQGRPEADRCLLITHPHPQYGGSMDNNVVWALAEAADRAGLGWLRFNFRGTGRSQGTFDNGRGEADDIRHALAWLAGGGSGGSGGRGGSGGEEKAPQVILAGYSFGAWVASGLDDLPPSVGATILVAPPQGFLVMDRPENFVSPILVIAGDQDQFGPRHLVEDLVGRLAEPRHLEVLPGVDHFFGGAEGRLIDLVVPFLAQIAAARPD